MDYMSNGLLLKRIHDSLEKKANNQLRPKDLTMMQIAVLMGLRGATEKQLSMKEIEQHNCRNCEKIRKKRICRITGGHLG